MDTFVGPHVTEIIAGVVIIRIEINGLAKESGRFLGVTGAFTSGTVSEIERAAGLDLFGIDFRRRLGIRKRGKSIGVIFLVGLQQAHEVGDLVLGRKLFL